MGSLGVGACYTFPSGTAVQPPPQTAEAPEPEPDPEPPALPPAASSAASDRAAAPAEAEREVADPAPSEPVPAGPTVASVCESLCQVVDGRCEPAAARRCRGQCDVYVKKAEGCEAEYRAALECQAGAPERELCGNVAAAQCLSQFREIKRCERGEKPAQSAPPAARGLPDGWVPITDDELHFTIGMPPGAALDAEAKRRTWRASVGAVEYVVAELPAPGKAVTSQDLIKLAIEFAGYRCQKNLKLHGQFEIADEVAIRFDTMCHDGTEWHGMLRVRPDQALATAHHSARSDDAVLDPFIYSYRRLQAAP